jgi:hypothetical protein
MIAIAFPIAQLPHLLRPMEKMQEAEAALGGESDDA